MLSLYVCFLNVGYCFVIVFVVFVGVDVCFYVVEILVVVDVGIVYIGVYCIDLMMEC